MYRGNPKERRSRKRRTERLLKTAKTMEVILDHIRNGGSLINLCETWDVRYSDIISWVRADKQREVAYEKAFEDRSEWTDEMLLGELRAAARFDIRKLYYPKGHEFAGTRKPIYELDSETARMIQEIGEKGKVKVVDRLRSIETLARNRKLLTDKSEVDIGGKLEDILSMTWDDPPPAEAPAAPAEPAV